MGKSYKEAKVSTFTLEGRFVGFLGKVEEKPKLLWIDTAEGDRYLKLSKELRSPLREVLQPGDWIEISGKQKYKPKTGELKLKAQRVKLKTSPQRHEQPPVLPPPGVAPRTKASIMVCQKSSCRKRGAAEVCQAATGALRDRGLDDQVAIKETGCMKQCKQGPCMVVMPDKARYTRVDPNKMSMLVEKHFAAKLKPEERKARLSASNGKI
ncbi:MULTISPECIES: (2Fe-2S) ferredoxin domain-containing protein [unclassified Coleofasciculus]|uniref:(2Fe-2S) ferredoxin domain-containing protein n=1 Tax=unclassified Coleofasciculus TaxID=2692782 RepID=UPI0018813AAF|nr:MULTISPECIES: (2Fe-2S) ferredoxin domain-containing protein [unclassified Coleofasciculus]MBE9124667.1 (2Fe-2S) ferredoxin domain-containing protein [Coleofasciculus sp. LEGE 07081]MBE9146994.1 (2Fe-2S) ferredoxin domain-containing protein [Coleofasciculus sp. LEGE 07092]